MRLFNKLVIAHRAGSTAEAELVRLMLNAEGVYAVVSDGYPTRAQAFRAPDMGTGRNIFVPEEDIARARVTISESRRVFA